MVDTGVRDAKRTDQRSKKTIGWKCAHRGIVAAGGVAMFVLGTAAPAFADGGSSSDSTITADVTAGGAALGVHLGTGSGSAPTLPSVPALPPANVDGLVGTLDGQFGAATSTANKVLNPFGISLGESGTNGPSGAGGSGGTGETSSSDGSDGGGSSPLGASLDGQGALTPDAGGSSNLDADADTQASAAPATELAPESATLASAAGARDANAHGGGLSWEIVGIAAGALGAAAGANLFVVRRIRQAP